MRDGTREAWETASLSITLERNAFLRMKRYTLSMTLRGCVNRLKNLTGSFLETLLTNNLIIKAKEQKLVRTLRWTLAWVGSIA